jgi:phosphoribosyl-AMP cyclohydrolase
VFGSVGSVTTTKRGRTECLRRSATLRLAGLREPGMQQNGQMPGAVPQSSLAPDIAARLKRDEHGLFAAVAQQWDTGEVLMVGWMDDEALHRTLTSGRVTYFSRSRGTYWRKGDTSGHTQHVREVRLDCDGDALLVKVDQVGAACHTGDRTCFDAGLLTP